MSEQVGEQAHNILRIDDLQTYIGESHILQGCSLEVGKECVSLLGRNGMGKTTLLRSIMGLTPPRSGTIQWKDQNLVGMIPHKIAKTGIGYVPQGRRLFPLPGSGRAPYPDLPQSRFARLLDARTRSHFFPELADRRKVSGTKLTAANSKCRPLGGPWLPIRTSFCWMNLPRVCRRSPSTASSRSATSY